MSLQVEAFHLEVTPSVMSVASIRLFVCSFVRLSVRLFVRLFLRSFVRLFVCSFLRPFVKPVFVEVTYPEQILIPSNSLQFCPHCCSSSAWHDVAGHE